ncbi:MAG: hypothetical protein NTY19_04050 [Planctomycetota bacterium]|nr:hypothetical protein [Planctomycetota bacterium]
MTQADKTSLVESCQQVVETIKAWCHDGCPLDWDLINQAAGQPRVEDRGDNGDEETEPPVPVAQPISEKCYPQIELRVPVVEPIPETACPQQEDYPKCFYRADIQTIAGSSQWVQYVKFLIENGFPTEDKFCEIVSTLALWFGFVEFFGENRQRTKDILRTYVLSRHNNKVTRLITGETQEVLEQINRIVDNVLDNEQVEGKELFARIRQKQSTGQYKQLYHFAPQIDADYSSSYTPNNQPLHLICGGLIEEEIEAETARDNDTRWHYEPDLTPLPDDVISRIRTAFKIEKRQLRKDTTTGRYPNL